MNVSETYNLDWKLAAKLVERQKAANTVVAMQAKYRAERELANSLDEETAYPVEAIC